MSLSPTSGWACEPFSARPCNSSHFLFRKSCWYLGLSPVCFETLIPNSILLLLSPQGRPDQSVAAAACWGQRGNRVCSLLLSLSSLFKAPSLPPFPPTAMRWERLCSLDGLALRWVWVFFRGSFSPDAIQILEEDEMITVECHQFAAP